MARHRRNIPVASPGPLSSGRHRGERRRHHPVRTGLLASSAALAMGAVAMGAGVIPAPPKAPGGVNVADGDNSQGSPIDTGSPDTQGYQSAPTQPADRGGDDQAASRDQERSPAPEPSTTVPSQPQTSPSTKTPEAPAETAKPKTPSAPGKKAPPAAEDPGTANPGQGQEQSAENEVLRLVNIEREKAGCQPVKASKTLADLARDFSDDMAARGFFDHTNPEGQTPFDRAGLLGVLNLGGENIARGQTDAQAVMDAWMTSDGHRANILNCDYTTLGVGVHFGAGGPWWTQDFGF